MQTIIRTTSNNPDFQNLVNQLDAVLAIMDGDEHAFFSQFNKLDTIKNVVIYYENEIAIGCGAFKKYEDKKVEIKRMFVNPDFRGKGIALQILAELELWASEQGFQELILETGINNPKAIALYTKAGFKVTQNYGPYANVESSCCMKKILK